MKSLLKNIGIILIFIGTAVLLFSAVTGNVNNNVVLGGSLATIIAGLLAYIIINKNIAD
ncbi:MAG: hypothetical protein WCR36_09470 [Bacteroidaceae bacterium]